MTELPIASVVVCTRNRSRTLEESLEALERLDYPSDRWEILVVDNASTDDTLDVAREFASRCARARVVEEPELGLSAARNTGVRHATGKIIAFADDDSFPDPPWLRALAKVLLRPDALVAGGPVRPRFQGELPGWFGERFLPYLAVWDRGTEVHALTYNEYPRGNNIAFRREVFDRFGDFSRHLGRTGRSLLSCEEIELCLRVERGGGQILYVPGAAIEHVTVVERLDPEWLERRFFAQGRSEAILEWQHAGWRGLLRGWSRLRRIARHASARQELQLEDRILARCSRKGLAGHTVGALTAPFTVPRYRPREPAAPWLPAA